LLAKIQPQIFLEQPTSKKGGKINKYVVFGKLNFKKQLVLLLAKIQPQKDLQ
jgi:hypothetical protein